MAQAFQFCLESEIALDSRLANNASLNWASNVIEICLKSQAWDSPRAAETAPSLPTFLLTSWVMLLVPSMSFMP